MDNLLLQWNRHFPQAFSVDTMYYRTVCSINIGHSTLILDSARNVESYRSHDSFSSSGMYMAHIWPHGEKQETCLYRALIINLVVSL